MAPSTARMDGAVYRLVMLLLEHGAPSERHLLMAASLLSRSDYSDLVEERNISLLCGFPLCSRPLNPKSSRRGCNQERDKFCSEQCLSASRAYEATLSKKKAVDRMSWDEKEAILKSFEEGEKDTDLGMSKLTISDESARNSASGLKPISQEIDFGSLESRCISDEISKKLERIVLDDITNKKTKSTIHSLKNDKRNPQQKNYGLRLKPSLKKKGKGALSGLMRWAEKELACAKGSNENSAMDASYKLSVELSPFGTLWNAIFGWVTRSTLCFLYGHDESLSEEFSEVEGQEYPQREVLKGEHFVEIRKALDGCVRLALRSLVSDLNLPVPFVSLEEHLGQLIDTFTLVESLPALKTRQWQVVVVLFMHALSVHHLPSLSTILTSRSFFHKVLSGAQIDETHYDSMVGFVLPLRSSQ